MVHGITTSHKTYIKDIELSHSSAIFLWQMQRPKYSRYISETAHIMFLQTQCIEAIVVLKTIFTYPKIQKHQLPVKAHESTGYPQIDISHWVAAVQYVLQFAQYQVIALICNTCHGHLLPVCPLAITLGNTELESIGYSKICLSHWDAENLCGLQPD